MFVKVIFTEDLMKKVLIISALDIWSIEYKKGGESLWQTLKGYAEKNWEVHFITSYKKKDFDKKIHSKYSNVFIHRLGLEELQSPVAIVPFAKMKLIRFLLRVLFWLIFQLRAFLKVKNIVRQKEKFLIIYGYGAYGVPIAKFLSMLWKVPVVSRFQGTLLKTFWMGKKFWKIRAWEHVIASKISTDLVIMTNDGTQGDKVLKYFGVDSEKVKFWMNGVNREDFKKTFNKENIKQELDISSRYILMTVSRLVHWKQVNRSIEALPRIIKVIPDLKLIIIGDGPEKENLERFSRELKVNHCIKFVGAVSREKIPKYLAASDVFLSFYNWTNIGNPVIEAMTMGKCIITLNNGDTGKIIRNDYNGILLEENKKLINNITESVIYLLRNLKLREKLGKNAREFAKKIFWTWEERINAEIKEIENLLKKRIKKNIFKEVRRY